MGGGRTLAYSDKTLTILQSINEFNLMTQVRYSRM
jgi:hypothetical protein